MRWAWLTTAVLAVASANVATPRSLAAASATAARPSPLLSEGRASLAAFERDRGVRQAAHAKRAAAEEDVADALRPSVLRLVLRAAWLGFVFSPVSSTAWLAALSPWFRLRVWYPLLTWCLGRSGACFVKWAQWSATRSDLFPDALCAELASLQAVSRTLERPLSRSHRFWLLPWDQ
jgi:hypothetical protein